MTCDVRPCSGPGGRDDDQTVQIDRNGLEVLDQDQCLALLRTATLGRVGLTSGALPVILPVNFHFDGEQILIRSGEGTKLDAAMRDAVVAFEADDFDPVDHSGWSVVVTGVARLLDDPDARQAILRLPLPRWAPGGDGHVLAISAQLVTGRRLDRVRTPAR